MPIRPDDATILAKGVREVFVESETILLGKLARALAQGLDEPDWVERKLLGIRATTADIDRILADLGKGLPGAVERAMNLAYNRGIATAGGELAQAGMESAAFGEIQVTGAVTALTRDTLGRIEPMMFQIQRATMDVYRQTISQTAAQVLTGTQTRREASRAALGKLTQAGITGFRDRAGRQWSMASYAEMATRTSSAQAMLQGHTDRISELGIDLVAISDAPEECSLCLVPGTVIEGPAPTGRSRLEYVGDVITITTASGKNLTGTPNHTVLTPSGWVRLDALIPGDKVISNDGQHSNAGIMPDHVQVPTLIEEAGKSLVPLFLAGPTRRDLDKGVTYREIRAELPNGYLLGELNTTISKPLRDLLFVGGVGTASGGTGVGNGFERFDTMGLSTPSVMCGLDHSSTLLGGCVGPSIEHGLTGHGGPFGRGEGCHMVDDSVMFGTCGNLSATEVIGDDPTADSVCSAELLGSLPCDVPGDKLRGLDVIEGAGSFALADSTHAAAGEGIYEPLVADAEGGHELLLRLASGVSADEIVDVSVSQYSGHVWDLTTEPSWFIANGIVTHNCRPFEGKVLSIDGTGVGKRLSDGKTVTASLSDAKSAGLFHPNCRHSQSAYLPGISTVPKDTEDVEGDQLRQQQRAYERRIRELKRRDAVDHEFGGAGAVDSRNKLRAKQSEFKAWRDEHDRKNLSYRTSLKSR